MKPNANPFRGVVLLICVLALIFCATSIFRTTTHQTTYSYADIRDLFQQEKVETVQVDEDILTLTLKEPVNGNNVVTYSIYSFQLFYDDFNDIVVQQYEDGRLPLYHFDVYRIGDISEMDEIGYEDCFYGQGVTLIEWSELIREILPEHFLLARSE